MSNKKRIIKCMCSPLYICLFFNIAFLLTFLMFGSIKYEVSDDFIMQMLVSGGYTGEPSEQIIFMNISVGYILSFLYKLIPTVNWYFWMHITVVFASLTSISYVVIKKQNSLLAKTMVFLFLCFFSNDLYLLIQFTKTATIALLASAIMLLEYVLCSQKHGRIYFIGAMTFLYIGAAIRFSAINIVLPYFLVLVLIIVIKLKSKGKFHKSFQKKVMISMMTCVLLLVGLKSIDKVYINSNEEYRIYSEFNTIRSRVLDYPYYRYEDNRDKFEELDITETDFINLIHWNFIDSDLYTIETFNKIYDVLSEYRVGNYLGIRNCINQMVSRNYYKYISLIGCLMLCFMILISYRKSAFYIIVGICGSFAILFLYTYMGRLLYRIEYATFLSLAVTLLYLCNYFTAREQSYRIGLLSLNIILLFGRIPIYIPNYDNSFHKMFFSMENGVKKYNAAFSTVNRQIDLISEFQQHPENFYFLGFQTVLQQYYLNYSVFTPGTEIPFRNAVFLSGVDTKHPDWNKVLTNTNFTNPAKALLESNVYLVENISDEEILNLLNERNSSKIEKVLYKELNGYKIWKFVYK